jgi:hypothetical protein
LGNAHGWVTNPLANWAQEIARQLGYSNATIAVSTEHIRIGLVQFSMWRYYRTPLWQVLLLGITDASAKSLLTRENVEALLNLALDIAGYKGEEAMRRTDMAKDREHQRAIWKISDCLEAACTELEMAMIRLEVAMSEASKIDSPNIDKISLAHRMAEDALHYVREVSQLYG